jgi:hypothetical protein
MPNLLYNNSIAIKLLVGKVGEFWWETLLWLKLIISHCNYNKKNKDPILEKKDLSYLN